MSYQYIPSLTTNEAGEEVPNYEEGTLSLSRDMHRGLAPEGFDHNELTGQTEYFEVNEKDEVDLFQMSEYLQTMQEVNPELSDAITYGNANLSPELMSELYTAIDEEDLERLNEMLVIILSEYDDAKVTTSEIEEETTDVEEVEEEEDDLLEVPDIEDLYSAEPDEELADTFTDLAYQSEGATQLLYQLSARFHSNQGEDANTLINEALSSGFSREELITAYNLINNN